MGTKLSELVEATAFALTDIFHLRTVGGIDKKITGTNLNKTIYNHGILKGFLAIQLTNYTGVGIPAIVANCPIEIDGSIYINPSEVAITGATVNSTWYDILLTPSGTSFTVSFIARGTGVWSDSKQGLYSGNNRVVACVYKDGSGNFINKNILTVINRTIKIKIEIGDWNMDLTTDKYVNHGLGAYWINIRKVSAIIRNDTGSKMYEFNTLHAGVVCGIIDDITSTNILFGRVAGQLFDHTDFDSTSYNRGWVPIEYEI